MINTDAHPQILDLFKTQLNEVSIQLIPLAGDASNRIYYRAVNDEDQSWVVMCWDPFELNNDYPFLSVLNHFSECGIQVPKVYAQSPNDGLIILEDLGDLTLERKFWESQNQESVLPFYKKTLEELFKIHTAATLTQAPCTAFQIEFSTEKLLWEMNYAKKHLLQDLCQLNFTSQEAKELDECFHSIASQLSNKPQVICHRDFHSRNVMIKLATVKIIDFQDARLGPLAYDLVSLLEDSYVQINQSIKNELIEFYFNLYQEHTPVETKEDFLKSYQLQLIQRCFKACGSFSSFYVLRKDKRYVKYIKPTLTKVTKTLVDYPEYKSFLNIIIENGLLQRNFGAL